MPFDDIVGPIVAMAEDSVVVSRPIEIMVEGDLGEMTADMATPLAVAMAELLQNAVEHAFAVDPDSEEVGHVFVTLRHDPQTLVVEVRDDGDGLPEGFDLETTTSLGLNIVRDLVRTQLLGTIELVRVAKEQGGGSRATIAVPLQDQHRQIGLL